MHISLCPRSSHLYSPLSHSSLCSSVLAAHLQQRGLQASVPIGAALDSIFIKFSNWRKAWRQSAQEETATCGERVPQLGEQRRGGFAGSSLLHPPEQVWEQQVWAVTEASVVHPPEPPTEVRVCCVDLETIYTAFPALSPLEITVITFPSASSPVLGHVPLKEIGSLISSPEKKPQFILFYDLGFLLQPVRYCFCLCLCHVNSPVEVAQSILGEQFFVLFCGLFFF